MKKRKGAVHVSIVVSQHTVANDVVLVDSSFAIRVS